MPNVIAFPKPENEAATARAWMLRCDCGSLKFHVYACGAIACMVCDAVPHNPGRGEPRAYWSEESSLTALPPGLPQSQVGS